MTWHAGFISPSADVHSAPRFRREFDLEAGHGAVRTAELAFTALGVVEVYVNGARASEAVLTPGWSSYEWRLRVARVDVTALLRQRNALGFVVGNGWYRGRLGWIGASHHYGNRLAVFAELTVTYEDGATQLLLTDDTWTAGPSDVLADDLYDGETIDARRRGSAWALPGFDGAEWTTVDILEQDLGVLEDYIGPQVSRREELPAERIWQSPSGSTLVDFGQNLVGWVRVRVRGGAGSEIVLRHAEVLEGGELGVRPLRSAKATDRYVLSGGDDVFEPTFTLHGFRYAEVVGWPGVLEPTDVTAIVVGSELDRIGTFECSDPLLNRLHDNVVWGMRGNFVDLPTDCPQRDERLGWTGDIAAFAPTATYLFDVNGFLRDWLRDLAHEQEHHGGMVPVVVPDILQKSSSRGGTHQPVESTALWADAAVWVPWALWQAYGDRRVLEDQFDSMLAHVRHVESLLSPNGLWDTGFQYGDWLDPTAPPDDPAAAKADPGVVATACIFRSARMTAEAARLLGRHEAEELEDLADRLRAAFNEHYVSGGTITSDATTVYSLAIVFGLLSEADRVVAGARLAQLVTQAAYRISTGFAGTPFITDALTMTDHTDTAYRLLLEKENPSWLYPVTMGATTVWERWDSMLRDGRINPGEMTSFNHYALGAVADWMHRTIGGISPLEPGYSRILLAPIPGGGLSWAKASLRTPHGQVSIHWWLEAETLRADVRVPDGTTAVLRLPGETDIQLGPGLHQASTLVR
ncbi:alpha-L-rhamnosidase [Rathayibacter sp. CAU 1779]